MIHQIFAFTIKEFNVLWRDREALALLFAMPVFFILIMTFALEGLFETGSKTHPIEILLINGDRGQLAEKAVRDLRKTESFLIIDSIDGMSIGLEKAKDLIGRGKYPLALYFKTHFSEQILRGTNRNKNDDPVVSLIFDPTINILILSSVKGTIQGIIERQSLLISLPQLIKQGIEHIEDQSKSEIATIFNDLESRFESMFTNIISVSLDRENFTLQTIPVTTFESDRRPTSAEQNVPGYTIFGVFFIVLTLASSFINEKNSGTFQRILTSPLPKSALVLGKLIPYYLINLIQITLMFAVGILFFDLRLISIPAMTIVSLALSAAAIGLGLMVAAICRTEAQVNSLSVLLAILLSALGGMMVPTFVMPSFMKSLSLFTPHAWALAGYHDIIIRGLGVINVLDETSVLIAFSALFFLIALWRFRFD